MFEDLDLKIDTENTAVSRGPLTWVDCPISYLGYTCVTHINPKIG